MQESIEPRNAPTATSSLPVGTSGLPTEQRGSNESCMGRTTIRPYCHRSTRNQHSLFPPASQPETGQAGHRATVIALAGMGGACTGRRLGPGPAAAVVTIDYVSDPPLLVSRSCLHRDAAGTNATPHIATATAHAPPPYDELSVGRQAQQRTIAFFFGQFANRGGSLYLTQRGPVRTNAQCGRRNCSK